MVKELASQCFHEDTDNKREKNTVQKPQTCPDRASLPACSQSPLKHDSSKELRL